MYGSTGKKSTVIGNSLGGRCGDQNVIIGDNVVNGFVVTTPNTSVMIGSDITYYGTQDMIVLGNTIGALNSSNIVIGKTVGAISGNHNICMGFNLPTNAFANTNVVVGNSITFDMGGSCDNNVIIGDTITATTSGSTPISCVILGSTHNFPVVTGISHSVHIGTNHSIQYNYSVCLGNNASVTNDNAVQILDPAGVAANSYMKVQSQQVMTGGWIGGGTTTASIDNSGNIIRTVSDERAKENITEAESQTDKIKQLQVKEFNYKDTKKYGAQREIGLIAQEVAAIYPNLVNPSGEGDLLGLNYTGLIPPILNTLQDILRRLEILEKAFL